MLNFILFHPIPVAMATVMALCALAEATAAYRPKLSPYALNRRRQ